MTDTVNVPLKCRQRLASEGKAYPRSSCDVCGPFAPNWMSCDATLAAAPKAEPESVAQRMASDNGLKVAKDIHDAFAKLIYGIPDYLNAENLTDEERVIQEAHIVLDATAHRIAHLELAHPEAPKVEQEPVAWRDWSAGSRPPMSGEWFVAKCAEAVRVVHYADKHDRLPIDHSGWVWPSLPTHWVPLREYAHPASASDELLEAKATVLDSLLSSEIDGRTAKARLIEYRTGVLAIAQHKGPQS